MVNEKYLCLIQFGEMPRKINTTFVESTILLILNYFSPVLFVLCALLWYWSTAKSIVFDAIRGVIIHFIPDDETEVNKEDEDEDETFDSSFKVTDDDQNIDADVSQSLDNLWINKIISRFWTTCLLPNVTKEIFQDIRDKFYEDLQPEHPKIARFMREIEIEEVSLGDCPIKVAKINATNSKYEIALKIGIQYPGNGNFSVKWSHPKFHASVKNFEVYLPLEIILGPLTRDFTVLRAISVSFYGSPTMNLEGTRLLRLPVDLTLCLIKRVLLPMLEWFIIDPKSLKIRLPSEKFHYPVMSTPRGILKVILVEGKDLVEADSIFYLTRRSADPYCIIRVGRNWVKSNRVNKNINPVWNFVTEFPILSEESHNELIFELFDHNVVTDTGAIGLASIDLSDIDPDRESMTESWLNVSSATTTGYIRVMTQFVPCHEYLETEECRKGLLVIFIKTVESNQRIEPIIGVQISGKKLFTTARGNYGQHHEFVEQIVLLVDDIEEDLFRVCLYDAAKEYINPKKWIQKGISVVHKSMHRESLAHKQGSMEDMDFYMISEFVSPVKDYLEKKTNKIQLFPKAEIETSIELSGKVYQLNSPERVLEEFLN